MVSFGLTAQTAALYSAAAAVTSVIICCVTKGLAPSCISTISVSVHLSPSYTESCLCAPPATVLCSMPFRTSSHRSIYAMSATTIILSITGQEANIPAVFRSMTSPPVFIYCLGRRPPIRLPLPAAAIITVTVLSLYIICPVVFLVLQISYGLPKSAAHLLQLLLCSCLYVCSLPQLLS